MTLGIQPAKSDLIGTDPTGDDWEPATVHTHYFGFQVPEAQIGGFTYIRYQPYFPLSQGNVIIFQGIDNVSHLDCEYLDWQMAMPYPTTQGNVITSPSGYRIEFLELGTTARITYESRDGGTSFDLLQEAVSPLIARGAVIPGENLINAHEPGGSEQYMHVTGALQLNGSDYDVDCYMPRDRSWRQSRTEVRGGRHDPPIAWTPIYFPENKLAFNQVGFEAPDSNPTWEAELAIPDGMPTHHFAWVYEHDELREIADVRRAVHELHPWVHAPMRQTIECRDALGREYSFTGETVAMASIPSWPNAGTYDSVIRWTDDNAPPETRRELQGLVEIFRGRVVDVGPEQMTLKISGQEKKIEAFIDAVRPYGIRELVRTGRIAMVRGSGIVERGTLDTFPDPEASEDAAASVVGHSHL